MSMPGFVFYFRCDDCDRNSEDYSLWPFPDLFRPDISLPAWSRAHQCWASVRLSLRSEQRETLTSNSQSMLDFAASLSSDTITVCVPQMHSDSGECAVSVTPKAVCPICGEACLTIFGYPPEEQQPSTVHIQPEEWPLVPISALNMSLRTRNICASLDVRTWGQMRAKREAIVSHPRACSTTIQEIDRWLALGKLV